MTRTCPPAASANCCISGSSSRQGAHQLPQRLTTVGTPGARPRSSDPAAGAVEGQRGQQRRRPVAGAVGLLGAGGQRRSGGADARSAARRSAAAVRGAAASAAASRSAATAARARTRHSVSEAAGDLTSFSADLGIDRPDAVRGAPLRQPAGPAGRLLRVADPPSVEDHPVAEVGPLLLRDSSAISASTLTGSLLLGPAEPAHQPAEVRVDGQARDAEGVAEDDVRRLAADARAGSPDRSSGRAPRRRTARPAPGRGRAPSWPWPGRTRSA